jgi:hypothetical protein
MVRTVQLMYLKDVWTMLSPQLGRRCVFDSHVVQQLIEIMAVNHNKALEARVLHKRCQGTSALLCLALRTASSSNLMIIGN